MHECPQRGLRLQNLNTHANGGFGLLTSTKLSPPLANFCAAAWQQRAHKD
jgi:hypothetical protein